jgi:hypothetical protein
MTSKTYVIVRKGRNWSISYGEEAFDRFGDKDEAVRTAIAWACNAAAQGHDIQVWLRDGGVEELLWEGVGARGPAEDVPAAPRRPGLGRAADRTQPPHRMPGAQ